MFGIARNYSFLDGNKRTAFAAADVFLQANGYDLPAAIDSKWLAERFIAAIGRQISEADFIHSLQLYLPIASD